MERGACGPVKPQALVRPQNDKAEPVTSPQTAWPKLQLHCGTLLRVLSMDMKASLVGYNFTAAIKTAQGFCLGHIYGS